jgi:phage terminase Nu1 subunit (DNA packaging protein)
VIVNRAQLADIFGISLPTVDAWKRAGCPVLQHGAKGVAMQFDTAAVTKWRQQVILADATGDKQQDADEIDRRTKRAKMRQAELDLAKEMGLVAPIRDFERVQAARAAVVRQNIMNVPARAVLQLLGCTDESTFKQVLRKELTLALEQSANAALDLPEDDAEDAES